MRHFYKKERERESKGERKMGRAPGIGAWPSNARGEGARAEPRGLGVARLPSV